MELDKYIKNCFEVLPGLADYNYPWEITAKANEIVGNYLTNLSLVEDYEIKNGVAIHKTATVEEGVIMKNNVVIGKNCFVGAGAYLRGGVFLAENVSVGPGCEIKSSFIFSKSRIAHFNFIGDSIVGADVNFEAGAIVANFFNDTEKEVEVIFNEERIQTGMKKFGALVGDHARIGANAVLDPGSVLPPSAIVGRLEHYDQFRSV